MKKLKLHEPKNLNPRDQFIYLNRSGKVTFRDIEILKDIYKFRFMAASHLERLFFKTSQAANRRLLKLIDYGLLDRFRPVSYSTGTFEFVYCLGTVGVYFIAQAFNCNPSKIHWRERDNEVNLFFIDHYIETAEVYVLLKQFDIRKILAYPDLKYMKPDLYIEIVHNGYRYYFFIEVDRATEREQKIQAKVKGYDRYFKEAKIHPKAIFKVPNQEREKQLKKWIHAKYIVTTDIYKTISKYVDYGSL